MTHLCAAFRASTTSAMQLQHSGALIFLMLTVGLFATRAVTSNIPTGRTQRVFQMRSRLITAYRVHLRTLFPLEPTEL